MRFRLDAQHYADDRLLEEGTEVGDGTAFSWRYEGGSPRPPSRSMTPLDDEAKRMFIKYFGQEPIERDPTKSIPIQGKVLSESAPKLSQGASK